MVRSTNRSTALIEPPRRLMLSWDVEVGQTMLRSELHDRWGGGRYGGMEPSVKAESVFLFTKPGAGHVFGYTYDGWDPDVHSTIPGDGQLLDQSPDTGGNKIPA